MPDALANWLQQARAYLEQAKGGPAEGAVTVVVRDEAGAKLLHVLPAETGQENGPALPALSPLEARVVDAIAQAPGGVLIAKAVAARLKVPCDGRFRFLLSNLCERRPPVLESTHHGYRLARGQVGHEDAHD